MAEYREEIAKTLLLSTWERYDKAVGRLGIALIVALLVHLQVAQYLEFDRGIAQAKEEEEQLSSRLTAVNNVGTAVNQLRDDLGKAVKSVLENFAPGLRKQFLALDEQYAALVSAAMQQQLPARRGSTGPPHGESPADGLAVQEDVSPTAQRNVANMMLQSAPITQNRHIELSLSEKSKSEIGAARSLEELTDTLHKIAEREIVEPVFAKLNQRWSQDHRTAAVAKIDAVLEKLSAAKAMLPEKSTTWEEVQRVIEEVRHTVGSFEFKQPTQSRWWSTVGGKLETGMRLSDEANDRMVDRLPSEVIDRIGRALKDALDRQSQIAGALEDELQTVQERFTHLKERAASLGKPFEMISLDLRTTADHFPLLAGLGCAVGLAWLGYWRGRMLRAASWMRLGDADSQSLSPLPFLESGPRSRYRSELILGIIGIGWVVIAVWQLRRASGELSGNTIAETAIGVAAVVLALVYRARTATTLVKRPATDQVLD